MRTTAITLAILFTLTLGACGRQPAGNVTTGDEPGATTTTAAPTTKVTVAANPTTTRKLPEFTGTGGKIEPTTTAAPTTKATVATSESVRYETCADARNAGVSNIRRGIDPGYRADLDSDGDGIACEE